MRSLILTGAHYATMGRNYGAQGGRASITFVLDSGENRMHLAVIDDHPLILDAVAAAVRAMPGGHQASVFPTLEAFDVSIAAGATYDLVLLDLDLPGFGRVVDHPTKALISYRQRHPEIPVVVLSALDAKDIILRALDEEAMGFIPKTSNREILMHAIEIVASGGIYIPKEAVGADLGQIALSKAGAPRGSERMHRGRAGHDGRDVLPAALIRLTSRQRDVLNLLIKGLPNKLICRQLNLSPNTVKSHVSAVLRSLDAENRTQAVIAAQRLGVCLDYD